MKIKYLLVAVAMIGLTSFSNEFGRNFKSLQKQIVQNSNFRREINS
jgi:hypothetical protein